MKRLLLPLVLVPAVVLSHPVGTHKRVSLVVSRDGVDGLVTLDVDSGPNAQLYRAQADADRNGKLSKAETAALKQTLVALAARELKVTVSGQALSVAVVDTKVSLREDDRVGTAGLSVALMVRAKFPGAPIAGMRLQVRDVSPDKSPVAVDVSAVGAGDAGAVGLEQKELEPDAVVDVRLPALGR